MGVALGIAWLPSQLLRQQSAHLEKTLLEEAKKVEQSHISLFSRAVACARQLDYRILLIGSLLPDIIDKSTSLIFPSLNSPKGFAHSLLFAITILVVSLYLHIKRGNFKGVPLAFGTLVHLILDQMWLLPNTLLWPVYGWGFEGPKIAIPGNLWGSLNSVLQSIWSSVMTSRVYLAFEIIGALILTAFFANLLKQKRLGIFLKTGSAD